jgi:hypothetical protein
MGKKNLTIHLKSGRKIKAESFKVTIVGKNHDSNYLDSFTDVINYLASKESFPLGILYQMNKKHEFIQKDSIESIRYVHKS